MPDSESDDSENEGSVGNVIRVVIRPAGHSGKAKKGHLCFDASFETGNLGRVQLISQFEYDLFIRPDSSNPRIRLWFNFTVDNTKPDQRVILNIVNMSKRWNCFREGATPLVRSTSRPSWQRMPRNNVFYHSSPFHGNNYILSLSFNFDKEEELYQFAFCYPYSYSRCQAHLDNLENRNLPHFNRQLLGHSIQKRRLDLVTITHPKNLIVEEGRKVHVVLILARIHPGETPSSFVCQGIIDFLISNQAAAVTLREQLVFKIIPMVNPDGVFIGNYRCNPTGADLNRCWGKISQWLHPSLNTYYGYLKSLDQDKNIELDFVLDIHAHSNLNGVFIYGNTYNDVYRYERHIVFPKLLSQNVMGFEPTNMVFNRDANKAHTSRRFLCDSLKDSVNCYTLMVSFYGFCQKNGRYFHSFTEDSYYHIGRNVVQTFLDYYKVTGLIDGRARKERPPKRQNKIRAPRRGVVLTIGRLEESKYKRYTGGNITSIQLRLSPTPASKRRPLSKRLKSAPTVRSIPSIPSKPSLSIIDFSTMAQQAFELSSKAHLPKNQQNSNIPQ